jgi:hypothetical protein
VIIRVMSGKRDLVACEPDSGWAFRCAFDVQIGDVVLVSGDTGPWEANGGELRGLCWLGRRGGVRWHRSPGMTAVG